MSRIVLSAGVRSDFDRVPENAALHIEAIMAALDVLASSPLIGRPVALGQRELVISHGASGYLSLYRYDPALDTVWVLAVRSRRERDYKQAP